MFRYFLPIFITTLLCANTLNSNPQTVLLDKTFFIEANSSIFDTNIDYTHKPLLSCSPKIDAVYKVESGLKLKVIPKKRLRSGTNYSCSYEREKFSFSTEALAVEDYHFFKRDKILRIDFNDNIDLDSAKKNIKLLKIDKLSKTSLKYTIKESSADTLLLKIDEAIHKKPVELIIAKGLKSSHAATLNSEFSDSFNNSDIPIVELNKNKKAMVFTDEPQMIALKNGQFAIRLFFDDTLEGTPENSIEIEGIENFRLDMDNYINNSIREKFELSEDVYYYTDILSSEFKPNSTYKLTLKKGLKNYRELKEDKTYIVKSSNRAKSIIFDGDKPYISDVGELGFTSINIDSATIVVERILDDNLRYFMNFSGADRELVPTYTKELFSKKLTLSNVKNEITKQKISLKTIMGNLPYGVYNITLRYKQGEEELSSSKVLFLSNFGISANLSKDQALITVLTLNSAKPVLSAMVEIYGANNELLGRARTDMNGVAVINKKGLLEKNPKGVIVKTTNNQNFLALRETISSPTPEQILEKKERFKAHIYFQSEIVRPASKINALITVKDRDFISANKIPVRVILQEQYGKTLQNKVYHTDEYGVVDFNYQLDTLDRTGTYNLMVKIGDTLIGNENLKVEAFMPPKIENSVTTSKEEYYTGELIEASVSSAYLFGSPASGLQGKVTLDTEDIEFRHPKYKNYSFSNSELKKSNTQTYLNFEDEIKLDRDGKLNIAIPTIVKQRVPSMLEAMIGVTIMDDTQPVSNYKKVKLYPYRAMVGVKLDKDSLQKGEKLKGKAVLIEPISAELINRELYAVVKKIDWHYNYSSGYYNWERESTIVDSFKIESNKEFSRELGENGEYIIEIHDHLGKHSASLEFSIWWDSYSSISPKQDLKSVEINFEDRLYQKGDKIIASFKSPILKGQLLVTLEGEKVEYYKVIELEKGVAKLDIPIKIDMKRGMRLHATAFRATDSSSKLIPYRATGYKIVRANRNLHNIDIKLNVPNTTKSKKALKLGIKTDRPSKILISIVDRGILQLTGQEAPEIFEYFDEIPDKQISHYDLYDQLMSYIAEGKLIDFGAGDIVGVAKKQKHLAPDLGKRIKPFMKWSGLIETKGNELSAEIDIPEFNGRASIVVVAINADSVGVVSKDITVKDDIMIKPSYPRYSLAGDKLDIPVRIFNTTKDNKVVKLSSKLSDNLSFELSKNELEIPANSSKVIEAKLLAKEVGKGTITIFANYGNESVNNSVELPIYSPYAISTKIFKGITNSTKKITVPKEYANAKVYLTISNNLIGSLRGDLKYLVGYPYGCAEQTSSKILAMHYAKPFMQDDSLVKESKNFIRQGIKKLGTMQNFYGEFSYWENGGYVNAYASLYAAQTLLELKRDGTEMDSWITDRAIKMLKSVANNSGDYYGKYSKFHRLYASYILAENKSLDDSTANMLYEQKIYAGHFLSTYYMSAILKMQGKDMEAQKLYDSVGYTLTAYINSRYGDRSGNFESNRRDMFLHSIIKSQYFKKEEKDLITLQKTFDELYSTQDKAMALKAVSIFLGRPDNSKLDVDININGSSKNYTKSGTFMLKKLTSNTITLTPKGNAISYSVELVKHLPKKIKNRTSTNKELSIKRQFVDEDKNIVDLKNLHQGDKIYSKLTIANYGKISNVVVSQRVPSCMTIVNERIKDEKIDKDFANQNINLDYKDIRDDRVLNFIDLYKKMQKGRVVENRGVIFTPFIVTTIGECQLPAVITEAMYDSRISDYAKAVDSIVVAKKGSKPSTPKPKTKESLESKAKKFVEELYIKEMSSNDAKEFVNLFHYPLSIYFRSRNLKKEDVLKDKEKYFREWSSRKYSNMKFDTISIDEKRKEVKIKIVFDYLISNGKKELKGVSRHLLTVKNIDNKLLVTKVELAK